MKVGVTRFNMDGSGSNQSVSASNSPMMNKDVQQPFHQGELNRVHDFILLTFPIIILLSSNMEIYRSTSAQYWYTWNYLQAYVYCSAEWRDDEKILTQIYASEGWLIVADTRYEISFQSRNNLSCHFGQLALMLIWKITWKHKLNSQRTTTILLLLLINSKYIYYMHSHRYETIKRPSH